MLNDISAASYILRGFQLITKPGLRRFVIIPFMVNLLIFVAVVWVGSHYLDQLMLWVTAHLPRNVHEITFTTPVK